MRNRANFLAQNNKAKSGRESGTASKCWLGFYILIAVLITGFTRCLHHITDNSHRKSTHAHPVSFHTHICWSTVIWVVQSKLLIDKCFKTYLKIDIFTYPCGQLTFANLQRLKWVSFDNRNDPLPNRLHSMNINDSAGNSLYSFLNLKRSLEWHYNEGELLLQKYVNIHKVTLCSKGSGYFEITSVYLRIALQKLN